MPGRFRDGQHGHGPAQEEHPAMQGGDVRVATGTRTKVVAEFIVTSTKSGGPSGALETPHGPVAAFQAPMVLFQPVIEIAAGAVAHALPSPVGMARGWLSWPSVVIRSSVMPAESRAICACDGFGGSEKRLCRRPIPALAEQHVHERAGAADGAVYAAPAPAHLQVCLSDVTAAADAAPASAPQLLGPSGRERGLPTRARPRG